MAVDPLTIGLGAANLLAGLIGVGRRMKDRSGQDRIRRLLQQAQDRNAQQAAGIAGSGAGINPALAQRAALDYLAQANDQATRGAMNQEAAMAVQDRERTDRLTGTGLGALGAFGSTILSSLQQGREDETQAAEDAAARTASAAEAAPAAERPTRQNEAGQIVYEDQDLRPRRADGTRIGPEGGTFEGLVAGPLPRENGEVNRENLLDQYLEGKISPANMANLEAIYAGDREPRGVTSGQAPSEAQFRGTNLGMRSRDIPGTVGEGRDPVQDIVDRVRAERVASGAVPEVDYEGIRRRVLEESRTGLLERAEEEFNELAARARARRTMISPEAADEEFNRLMVEAAERREAGRIPTVPVSNDPFDPIDDLPAPTDMAFNLAEAAAAAPDADMEFAASDELPADMELTEDEVRAPAAPALGRVPARAEGGFFQPGDISAEGSVPDALRRPGVSDEEREAYRRFINEYQIRSPLVRERIAREIRLAEDARMREINRGQQILARDDKSLIMTDEQKAAQEAADAAAAAAEAEAERVARARAIARARARRAAAQVDMNFTLAEAEAAAEEAGQPPAPPAAGFEDEEAGMSMPGQRPGIETEDPGMSPPPPPTPSEEAVSSVSSSVGQGVVNRMIRTHGSEVVAAVLNDPDNERSQEFLRGSGVTDQQIRALSAMAAARRLAGNKDVNDASLAAALDFHVRATGHPPAGPKPVSRRQPGIAERTGQAARAVADLPGRAAGAVGRAARAVEGAVDEHVIDPLERIGSDVASGYRSGR